jgi:signal transduction histidine kinase
MTPSKSQGKKKVGMVPADMESMSNNTELKRAQNDLRRFAGILSQSHIPFWQRNCDLTMVYCNQSFSELMEQDVDDLLDIAGLELFKGHAELARRAWESQKEVVIEQHLVVGGKRHLFRIHEIPVPTDGVITGYAIDITDQEAVRDQVNQHISAQQDFLESSTSAMAVFGKDTRLQSYNFAFTALWRLDESFLDTKPTFAELLEALRTKRRLPEVANFPAFKQQQLRLFHDLIEPHEEFFYLPDEKILRVLAIPHALGGLLFAYEDVTDRLALERSYNTLIAVQRETLDNLHEAVVVVGEDGRLKLSNPNYANLWQLEEKLLVTEPHIRDVLDLCKDYFQVPDWASFKSNFIARLQQRKVQHGRMERGDGVVLDWRMVPLPDGGMLLTYTDMTDSMLVERSLREKNEALQAADRTKTEFLANISYELRSPLTSISGFSDILRNEYFGGLTEKQREYVEGIHQSSQHLGQLINNILDLASIEAGYMHLDISEFDLYQVLESVLLLFKERLRVLDLSIDLQSEPDIGTIAADETRIKQVMFNLLSNAVKYSRPGGVIEVGAQSGDADTIIIWVKDRGVGIEETQQRLVFDKFYRAGAAAGQQSGSGLGLSIVKSFIELHHGSVTLESSPNAGTKVTCIFPRKAK